MKFNFSKTNDFYSICLALFPVFLILFPKLIILPILLIIPFIVNGLRKGEFSFAFIWTNLLFVLLYMLYMIYVMNTRHWDLAKFTLESKLSFIIFPLIFSFIPRNKIEYNFTLLSFIFSSLFLVVQGGLSSFYCYQSTHYAGCFWTTSFSSLHHPTYAATYFTISIVLVWYYYLKNKNKYLLIFSVVITLIFILAIGLCLSFAALLYLLIIIGSLIFYLIHNYFGKRVSFISLILLPLLLYCIVRYEPHLRGEYLNAKNYAVEYIENPSLFVKNKKYPMSGSESRLVMWTASFNAICKYPFGVGTGNVDEVLHNYLIKMDQSELAKKNYNPHNQYFQLFLELGILGLIFFISIIIATLKLGFKHNNCLLIIVSGSLLFNSLFESMLQRRSGIVFYTYVICLLVAYIQKNKFETAKSNRV